MKNTNGNRQRAVFRFCLCFVPWALGAFVLSSLREVGFAGEYLGEIELMEVGESGDPNDPNDPNEPTWAEMAVDTYFMIFIDVSDSMRTNDIEAIKKAEEMFVHYLADEVYEGDLYQASKHVILTEVINERYLQHMAAWNLDDPNATRYVNIFFTNEAEQDYYMEGSILYPTDKFMDDLKGNQDSGGFIYGLRNELSQRTFSIGKLYNVGGKQGKNIGGFHPVFAVHLYCAFNNVGEYADVNLADLALSYENIEGGLAVGDYLQCLVDTLDYSTAYISESEADDYSTQTLQQSEKRGQDQGSLFLI
ncbi:MAG: hypothetical protein JXM79_01435 [Sedimentisphaerales bacterium]|nr:hypothetical protein [Sedimentisphaerales bacterium]